MKDALVGYTGFVGSNICAYHDFQNLYNTKNIQEAYGTKPELLVYAGVRAEKFLANQNPDLDALNMNKALDNIKKIGPQRIVLISTIDVYNYPYGVDEDSPIEFDSIQPYGRNRYWLEQQVREVCPKNLIIRLPGLFGKNIKKNFLYDYLNIIPTMLYTDKFQELLDICIELKEFYIQQDNGYFKCKSLTDSERQRLRAIFEILPFSALNFTDSRGRYQYYNLASLWNHIEIALHYDFNVVNLVTEPIQIGELYKNLTGKIFNNYLTKKYPIYDVHTKHGSAYESEGSYVLSKERIINEIKEFILNEQAKS